MDAPSAAPAHRFASALSGHLHPVHAAEHVAARAAEGLGLSAGERADLVLLFISAHHVEATRAILYAVRRRLEPAVLIGVSAEAVVGGESELEGQPGVSLMAANLPGVTLRPFRCDHLPAVRDGMESDFATLAHGAGMEGDYRGSLLFIDPFSVPTNHLLPALTRAAHLARSRLPESERERRTPIIGGLASASPRPGGNVLIINDTIARSGGVGVSIQGPIRLDSLVSQGCRPVGQPLVVTAAKGQLISGLGGRSAIEALHELLESLPEQTRELLKKGLFVGRAISEYKDRFGRDDFLMRNVIGVDRASGSIAVADLLRVGQTIQFHVRDATTADEDLALLLDAQRLYDPPLGALLFTCNGRGTRLFQRPHHDAHAIARAFAPQAAGPDAAKGGIEIAPATHHGGPGSPSLLPLSGFFAAGEIGPIHNETFVHGQTACLALFRSL